MNDELWGIGKTWLTVWALIVIVSIAWLTDRIIADQWWMYIGTFLTVGGLKSGAVGVAGKIAGGKVEAAKVTSGTPPTNGGQ